MHKKINLLLVCSTVLYFQSTAQNLSQSPYGRYGIGDLSGTVQPQVTALGGGTSAITDSAYISLDQPASLRSLSRGQIAFEAGFSGTANRYTTIGNKSSGRNGGFEYFSLAFPVFKQFWSAGFHLRSLSNAGYVLRDTISDPAGNEAHLNYRASGGFSAFGFTNTLKLSRDINFGFTFRYLFGKLDYSSEVFYPSNDFVHNSVATRSTRLNDFDLTLGATALHRFRRPKPKTVEVKDSTGVVTVTKMERDSMHLLFGVTFSPERNIRSGMSYLALSFLNTTMGAMDTVHYIQNRDGEIILPMRAGGGITLRNCYNRWLATVDFAYTDWDRFRNFGLIDSVRSAYRISAGFQWIPRPEEKFPGNVPYFSRVRYRLGGFYSDGYLRINNKAIPEYGISFGIGLPIVLRTYGLRSATSLINITLSAGKRGKMPDNILAEEYLRLGIGFSLNDRWFNKRKYD